MVEVGTSIVNAQANAGGGETDGPTCRRLNGCRAIPTPENVCGTREVPLDEEEVMACLAIASLKASAGP